ncbi:hypothetical protein CCL07_16390 [Pseudomonas congelans]|uniref:DUF4123 domain-containing protein n=1 Tax=Pseudomonas congelans TaxID=200452 RepID=UPI000BB628CF|nr:DUF4123 domain-containing protein [Pseudomonas congelans]PBQ01830.1 hypothetical protein CCL07_16390 [Pseudomonas congelans]
MNKGNYLLIDGMLRPEAIKQLYQCDESIEIAPLYLGTQWSEIMDLGPVLVYAAHPSELIAQWHRHPEQRLDACVFLSNASLKIVSEHLQRFLTPFDYLGNSSLLRFADPLVMHYWLSSCGAEHLCSTLGPIEQFWVQSPLRNWQKNRDQAVTKFVNERPYQASQEGFPLLGEPQLQAFESCYRWLFEERLYEWVKKQDPLAFLDQSDDQIEIWLKRVLDSAIEWGLVSEYALATWADICHDWGLGFASSPQGHYQSWRAQYPEQQRLPPELRVAVLDEYRQKVRIDRNAMHDR